MLDGFALPIVCAASPYSFMQWFACLREIMHHPHLHEEEKYLWLWLATQSANNSSFCCSMSYEQIACSVNKPPKIIHRILFRLRIMGFLHADIPIWYGEPTLEMVKTVRSIKLLLPPKPLFLPDDKAVVLPRRNKNIPSSHLNLVGKKHAHRKKPWVKDVLGFVVFVLKRLVKFVLTYPHWGFR